MSINVFQKILSAIGITRPVKMVKGSYDAARSSDRLDTLFAQATSRSADAEGSESVRQIIRNRARLEYRNNGYCRGIVDTKANDVVGRRPVLEMQEEDIKLNAEIEKAFDSWAKEINIGRKIRLASAEKILSGEIFIVLINNKKLKNKVKLDLLVVEADRVTTPTEKVLLTSNDYEDGIQYDENGIPISYDILKLHPGGTSFIFKSGKDFNTIPAENVIHWYKQARPGQKRGVSEIASGIPLMPQLRRYTIATLTAAETAAAFSWLLVSQNKDVEQVEIDPMDDISLNLGSGLTAPAGWKPEQMKAEQPSTQYQDFKHELVAEIARALSMPMNIALLSSKGLNFASGKLDHLNYLKDNQARREDLSKDVMARIFFAFIEELRLVRRNIISIRQTDEVPAHTWHYDGTQHQDPAKEATGQEKRLQNHTTNLAIEYAERGLDWEKELQQAAREKKVLEELGLNKEEEEVSPPPQREDEDDEQEENDENENAA